MGTGQQLASETARAEALAALEHELRRDAEDRAMAAQAVLRIQKRGPRLASLVSTVSGSTLLTLPQRQGERLPHVPERMLR